MDNTFENHSAFNRHMSIDGNRVNNGVTKPSIYITCVKLKRAIKELSDIEVEDLFEKEMGMVELLQCRNKLVEKMERLFNWQILKALDILLTDGRYDALVYILKCKKPTKKLINNPSGRFYLLDIK